MTYCNNCNTIVSEKQKYNFCFSDMYYNTYNICDKCYDKIHSNLIQIDFSKLSLIKKKAEMLYLNKIKI